MEFVNIGVLAHVDAGKTSLTERLLFDAGVLTSVGSVDGGTTQTDSLDLERQRGITIRSAIASFRVGDCQVNLVDTPGHSDFVAEVERALRVLDGAVLVLSAVEGVQARTRFLMRSLRRLRIPTLLFVNKIDRPGARDKELVEDIQRMLAPNAVAITRAIDVGTRAARSIPCAITDPSFADEVAIALSHDDEAFLDRYTHGHVPPTQLRIELVRRTQSAAVLPLLHGSAVTGEGVATLRTAIVEMFPRSTTQGEQLRAEVFKIERGPAGEKIASVRVWDGELRERERIPIWHRGDDAPAASTEGRASIVEVFQHGVGTQRRSAPSGAIARVWGLHDAQIGDQLGSPTSSARTPTFGPPALATVVRPTDPGRKGDLFAALQLLSEQDPLIQLQRDEIADAAKLHLYGEVQKEVIASMVRESHGLEVHFEASLVLCIERPIGIGRSMQVFDRKGPNTFWVTIGLHVARGPDGSGTTYDVGKLRGLLPIAYHAALEDGVRQTLRRGPHGWPVQDCAVTLTHADFDPPQSTASDFRELAALLTAQALTAAGTEVLEPVHAYELEGPVDSLRELLSMLQHARATIEAQSTERAACRFLGKVPASAIHAIDRSLASITRGEGVLTTELSGFQPCRGTVPEREPVEPNPYDRAAYLSHIGGRAV